VNWVVARYSDAKEEANTENLTSCVQIQVSERVLKGIIKKAITMFEFMVYYFDVPKTTIYSCIKSRNLEI
jgi:hypothetical protein